MLVTVGTLRVKNVTKRFTIRTHPGRFDTCIGEWVSAYFHLYFSTGFFCCCCFLFVCVTVCIKSIHVHGYWTKAFNV